MGEPIIVTVARIISGTFGGAACIGLLLHATGIRHNDQLSLLEGTDMAVVAVVTGAAFITALFA